MKPIVVGLQQYEYAAQLRDFEKKLEAIRNGITSLPYPIIPSKGLTRNGAIYSTQMFIYAQAMGWNKIPEYLKKLFIQRREELNLIMVHSDLTTDFFIKLNARLKNEEKRIDAFIDSLMKIYQAIN